ncbi:uncharacterized protein LOC127090185 [Lathyrus oleraceus]|uniref:uncharacterized protein LOC127090185 n=1 Tax=Pisum sativum TaxID=3888 RepID=UPI0021CE6567|nr:uncharacterized protein LOC127090185 [Pisum sativum]
MKEIISKKRTIGDETTTFIENYSAVSQGRRILIKQKDPGAVIIPCAIEDRTFKNVLIDLRVGVSPMLFSIHQKLGIGKVSNTGTNLKFADQSAKHAYGIMEDVIVTIDEFSFPVDFVTIDMPGDEETLIILG